MRLNFRRGKYCCDCKPRRRATRGSARLVDRSGGHELRAGASRGIESSLAHFIEEYRDSDDPQDIVAVGSALRKYVATMSPADLPSVAALLDAGHKAQVPLGLELEICKMVYRKLVANPPGDKHAFAELEWCLTDVVRVYANDRLLSREKYGATASNAALVFVLLNGDRIPSVAQQLRAEGRLVSGTCCAAGAQRQPRVDSTFPRWQGRSRCP